MQKYFNRILILIIIFISGCELNHKNINTRDWNQATHTVMHKYEHKVDATFEDEFRSANIHYPPKKIALLAFKHEEKIELWAKNTGRWHYISSYPLTAYSGFLGPKLLDHDRQIPEGIYRITVLNPFSGLHLSMKLNYPNAYDLMHAHLDHRTRLGGDIFIHGKALSVGCLAVGDHAIEQLFVLVDEVGLNNTQVIIAPNDLRYHAALKSKKPEPYWVNDLYKKIVVKLQPFKIAPIATA